jgi:hypothetical protein
MTDSPAPSVAPGANATTRAPARAGNRRFWYLSTLRAHTKSPYKMDFHRKTLRALNRPKAARTVAVRRADELRVDLCRVLRGWYHLQGFSVIK